MKKTPTDREAHDLAYEIGALFINFSAFEHSLNLAVAVTYGLTDIQANALIRGLFPRQKIELLLAYAKKHWKDPAITLLKTLTTDAFALTDYRNEIAHGFIGHDSSGIFHTITFRGANRFDGNAKPLTAADVGEHVMMAIDLSVKFQNLADAVTEESAKHPPSQPEKHPAK